MDPSKLNPKRDRLYHLSAVGSIKDQNSKKHKIHLFTVGRLSRRGKYAEPKRGFFQCQRTDQFLFFRMKKKIVRVTQKFRTACKGNEFNCGRFFVRRCEIQLSSKCRETGKVSSECALAFIEEKLHYRTEKHSQNQSSRRSAYFLLRSQTAPLDPVLCVCRSLINTDPGCALTTEIPLSTVSFLGWDAFDRWQNKNLSEL